MELKKSGGASGKEAAGHARHSRMKVDPG